MECRRWPPAAGDVAAMACGRRAGGGARRTLRRAEPPARTGPVDLLFSLVARPDPSGTRAAGLHGLLAVPASPALPTPPPLSVPLPAGPLPCPADGSPPDGELLDYPRVGSVERPAAATDQPGTVGKLMDDQTSRMLAPLTPSVARRTAAPLVGDVAPPNSCHARVMQILTCEIALAVVTDPHPFSRVSLFGLTRPTHYFRGTHGTG